MEKGGTSASRYVLGTAVLAILLIIASLLLPWFNLFPSREDLAPARMFAYGVAVAASVSVMLRGYLLLRATGVALLAFAAPFIGFACCFKRSPDVGVGAVAVLSGAVLLVLVSGWWLRRPSSPVLAVPLPLRLAACVLVAGLLVYLLFPIRSLSHFFAIPGLLLADVYYGAVTSYRELRRRRP